MISRQGRWLEAPDLYHVDFPISSQISAGHGLWLGVGQGREEVEGQGKGEGKRGSERLRGKREEGRRTERERESPYLSSSVACFLFLSKW